MFKEYYLHLLALGLKKEKLKYPRIRLALFSFTLQYSKEKILASSLSFF